MKGIKIDGLFRIIRRDSACIGCVAWETPYIVFASLETGKEYRWHSDVIEIAEYYVSLYEGRIVSVQAFAYEDALRRVRLADCYNSFRGLSFYRKQKKASRLAGVASCK